MSPDGMPGSAVPRLPAGVRFVHDETRGRWLLLAPERVVEPDEVASEILARIDGQASVDLIASRLSEVFDGDPAEVREDVRTFLAELVDERLVEL